MVRGMFALFRVLPWVLLAAMSCKGGGGTTTDGGSTGSSSGAGSSTGTTGPGPTTDAPTTGSGATTDVSTTGTTAGPTSTGEAPSTGTTGAAGCEGDAPRVLLATTLGDMVVQLDRVNAPITVENFVAYVEDGFYDGTIFHRVVDDFVIQGGGFTPDLAEKPTEPPIPLEVAPALTHVDGAISMARTNDPDSATSQFFLCDGPQHFLDGDYAAFGVLVEGFEVLAAISAVAVQSDGDFDDVPVEDVIVTSARCV
jgi:peptidyl-prolyl cis-trans isomerase A (cyclophilin A)